MTVCGVTGDWSTTEWMLVVAPPTSTTRRLPMPGSPSAPSASRAAACNVALGVGMIGPPMNSAALSRPFAWVMWAMKISRISACAGSTSTVSRVGSTLLAL